MQLLSDLVELSGDGEEGPGEGAWHVDAGDVLLKAGFGVAAGFVRFHLRKSRRVWARHQVPISNGLTVTVVAELYVMAALPFAPRKMPASGMMACLPAATT